MAGFLRLRGPNSEADIRRHSYLASVNTSDVAIENRNSEQIPRRPSAAEFLRPDSTPQDAHQGSMDLPSSGRPSSPPVQDETQKHRRFSMLKFRHVSDSHLATRARLQADAAAAPPLPKPPEIITTAPTMDINEAAGTTKKKSRMRFPGRLKTSTETPILSNIDETTRLAKKERRKTMSESGPSGQGRVTFDDPNRSAQATPIWPPAYGDEVGSTLALPVNRLSESSRSDGSGEHGVYATTTTTHTIHTTTTFFRLPRRKKQGPLFPLPPRIIPPEHGSSLAVPTASGHSSLAKQSTGSDSPAVMALRMPALGDGSGLSSPLASPSHAALARSGMSIAIPASGSLVRQDSGASNHSSPARRLAMRGRSSTMSSLRGVPSEDALLTPTMASTRTSTSTGRKSFGDLFGLSHRLRQNSDSNFARNASGPATPGSSGSKNNSMQLSREPVIVIPERLEDDTPAKYLVRLEEAVSRGVVASVLCKHNDAFSQQVLRSYMRGFAFYGDPMDMAIRKLLMEVELPKETQHIDRCLQGFANRYHECNPGIYASPDQAYFIAFSLLILHTDVFNKNNKHKMQKHDYIKNTQGEGIFDEILECFYDNISYTPFIHVEDDLDLNGERILTQKMKKKSLFPRTSSDPTKRTLKEPVDPYTLIIDNKLDSLRPNLKEVMYLEEQYSYLGTATSLNMKNLLDTFFKTGVLQIISARSRPDAFVSDKTITNPEEATHGIVDIKITKVGLLWRKDAKKKKTRSPWQEWGAILTGAQLYFFRNTTWIKSLMHQQESHTKQGLEGIPVLFKPPLEQFKPDALMSTDDAVALLDSTYKKHKNAFLFIRHGGFEETFLADNEEEMNDWMAKLNYAAAFRTAGVRMRGIIGGNYDGQRTRGIRRLESSSGSSQSVQTLSGEVTIVSSKIDNKMAQDIMAARREIMAQKISESEEKLAVAEKQLDAQLRNARHLQILTPVQVKSREQVVLAAGRMAAKLKWIRMEIWRLKCHKDILGLDLEEEASISIASPAKVKVDGDTASDPSGLARLASKASTAATSLRTTRSTPSKPHLLSTPQQDKDLGLEDVFTTQPVLASSSSYHKAQASWELPPLVFDTRINRQASNSTAIQRSPVLSHTSSFPSIAHSPVKETNRSVSSPQVDSSEQAILEQNGLLTDSNEAKIPDNAVDEDGTVAGLQTEKDKEKADRGKIRRSLHRTLREAHVPTAHRSKRGSRESHGHIGGNSAISSTPSDEAKTDADTLIRGKGSFVVHGKKASVITFGEELSNMSPEERIRLRKQPHRSDSSSGAGATNNQFTSTLSEPIEFREHRESAASTSTATARSFRELHKRLSAHASNSKNGTHGLFGEIDRDGDDSDAAISFSDGRHTPLPPVEDENEDMDDEALSLGSAERQAAFYTPDVRSPVASPVGSPVASPIKERFVKGVGTAEQKVISEENGQGQGQEDSQVGTEDKE